MADPAFPLIDRELSRQLDALVPPALPADFAARLAAAALETPQVPAFTLLPSARWGRWRTISRHTRLGITVGGLALIGLGSVSAAAAGYLGEPVNRALHRLPVVGKLIEKVIPEKRHLRHAEPASAAGLRQRHGAESHDRDEPSRPPAAADAPPVALAPLAPMLGPGWQAGRMRVAPPWRYPGPLPRTVPPGPERRAAKAALREWRAVHPLPPEVIARRATIMAERRAIRADRLDGRGVAGPAWRRAQMPVPSAVPSPNLSPDTLATPAPSAATLKPGLDPALDPAPDPAGREQRRLERRRARIEARRLGLYPPVPHDWRRFIEPGWRVRPRLQN